MRYPLIFCLTLLGAAAWVSGDAMKPSPVVVELFESQGCSSCPPAEAVMNQLKNTFGESILLLTFHVDYWDSLGWKDPFSSPAFTNRQRDYAQRLGQDSMYTPEMIVQGQTGFVGSDGRRAESEVRRALEQTVPAPAFSATWIDAVHLQLSVVGVDSRFKQLTAVLFEDAPPVHVLRGENTGATMSGEHAVRLLMDLPPPAAGISRVTLPFHFQRGTEPWRATILLSDAQGHVSATSPVVLSRY